MSGGGGAGGGKGAGPVPQASRKLVQSLKEIVNRPEPEIYAALRECGMDPDEAVSRLLSQVELKKQSSCSVHLVNKSDEYVAFKVKTTSPKRYCVRPNTGVIRPKATCDFTVTMQAQRTAPPDMQLKDKFSVQTTVVPPGTSDEDLIPAFFSKETNTYIDESKLRVVLVDASRPPVEQLINSVPSTDAAVEAPVSRHRNLLAPKKDGYFVLNDIFMFICDEYDDQYHGTDYSCVDNTQQMDAPYAMAETATDYFIGEHEAREDSPHAPPLAPSPPIPEEEPVEEAPKTYASVLQRKGISHQAIHSALANKVTMGAVESQQSVPVVEKSNDTHPVASVPEDEEEILSVYVGNLSPSTSVFDLEKVFKAFGGIKPDGVAIRSRKETGVFFGFVEFEDHSGINNALNASPIELNGRLVHVEERRPNCVFPQGGKFLLEGAERAKLEADFEKALETIKDRRRLNWGDNATELFWKICNNKIDSIPKAEREWTGNTIIRDISLEIFYRTKVAYSSKQLFNKWRNMNKAPPKKKETNKAHGKKKEEDHKPLSAACEESEDDVQHLYKELEQLKITNKEDKEKYQRQYAAVCEEKQAVCEEKQMLIEKITHLEAELNKAEALRRGMLNQILELKGSIRVFCRVRPSLKEDESHNKSLLSFPRTGQFVGRRVYLEHQGVKVSFTCDRVFDPSDSQEMIFREISELVQSALDGKKVCIFAYGQTGSGKTYTMLGEDGDCTKGIIPRALEKIFETAESRESHGSVHTIKISMIEIYNGETRNLSSVDQAEVKTTTEALEALEKALDKRCVAKTMRNDKSSRSHFIFELSIYSYDKEKNVSEGILSIIDLAGSEQPETNASEERKNEATEINKSLLSLGIMINAIESGLAYINHRDSTLTNELKSSLAKDTKVLMFINVAPEEARADETNATFEFAARIKSCTKTVIHEKGIHEKMVFESPGVSRASRAKDASVLKFLSRNNTRIVNRQGPSFRKNFDVAPSCKKRKMYIND